MANKLNSLATPKNQSVNEADLLDRVAAGDESSFAQLYDAFAKPLFSVAMGILRDALAAEEILQEVFVQIWERAVSYDSKLGKPLTWAVILTRNRCIDRIRAQQRRNRLSEMIENSDSFRPAEGAAPSMGRLVIHEQVEAMRREMGKLPVDQRRAIELAFLSGLSQTEIAGQLQLPLGTVKARIRRGMLQLRARLEETEGSSACSPQNRV